MKSGPHFRDQIESFPLRPLLRQLKGIVKYDRYQENNFFRRLETEGRYEQPLALRAAN